MKLRKILALLPAVFMLAACNGGGVPDTKATLAEVEEATRKVTNGKITMACEFESVDPEAGLTTTFIHVAIDGDKSAIDLEGTGEYSMYTYPDEDGKLYMAFLEEGKWYKTDVTKDDSVDQFGVGKQYGLAGFDSKFTVKGNTFTMKDGEKIEHVLQEKDFDWDLEDYVDIDVTYTMTNVVVEIDSSNRLVKLECDLGSNLEDAITCHYTHTYDYTPVTLEIPDAEPYRF